MYFPSLDIRDLFANGFTMRRLLVVINRLLEMHGRSALATALLGEGASWSNVEHLIADVIDQQKIANWLVMRVNRASEETDIPFPDFTHRPGMQRHTPEDDVLSSAPPERFASAGEIAGALSSLQIGSVLGG